MIIGFNNSTPSYPNDCPCKGCAARKVGCHGECQAYAKFKSEIEEFRRMERIEKDKIEYGRPPVKKWRR